MNRPPRLSLLLPLLSSLGTASAADDFPIARPPPVVHEVPIPPPANQGKTPTTSGFIPDGEQVPEPKVTIVHRANAVIEEYRVNGKLYMIRVIPRIGFPYYLVDTTGDGSYDTRTTDLDSMAVPMWVIYSW